jgi:hypothetical protein
LIRKCSASPEDFSLSMIFKGSFYHYRISHSIDAYYVLGKHIIENFEDLLKLSSSFIKKDDGPLIHGLDELVKHYQFDPHGLPCRLSSKFVPSKIILPSNSRIIGNTNPLHVAVACVCKLDYLNDKYQIIKFYKIFS